MNWFILIFGLGIAFILVRLVFVARPAVRLDQARVDVQAGRAALVDVREPPEWAQGVAEQAVLLSFSDIRRHQPQTLRMLEQLRGKKLLLYCQSGTRSGMAATVLRKQGFDATNIGSLARCQRGGWMITPPSATAATSSL
jgi:rhodanese-related sulfurtransferase